MTSSRQKVLELLAAQRITAADADTLFAAMEEKRSRIWIWIFNPLERLPPRVAAALSALPVLLQLILERMGIRFSGAIDVKVGAGPGGWSRALLDVVVALPATAMVLWVAARVVGRRPRWVDMVAAVGLSRWPALLAGLLLLPAVGTTPDKLMHPSTLLLALGLASLPLVAWNIALLCLGFRTASGLRGGRLAATFVAALLAAELLAKVVLLLA